MTSLQKGWERARARFEERVGPTAAWRAVARFISDTMTDSAATLAYYAMLSLFPGLLFALTIVGLAGGEGLVSQIVRFARQRGADTATAQVVEQVARAATERSSGTLTIALVISLLLLLNSASGAFNAAGRAVNRAHDVAEDRSFVRRRIVVVGLTLVVIALFVLSMAAIFVGGELATRLFAHVGLGEQAAAVWDVLRWPFALACALAGVAIVLRYAPAEAAQRRRLITSGSLVTVVLWVLGSAGFAVYVKGFSHYGALYGVFSTAVVLLVWLYLMSVAFLYGAELDGELRRRRVAREARSIDSPPLR